MEKRTRLTDQEKATEYMRLMREYDVVERKISKLNATGGGINLSDEILAEIAKYKIEQQVIVDKTADLHRN